MKIRLKLRNLTLVVILVFIIILSLAATIYLFQIINSLKTISQPNPVNEAAEPCVGVNVPATADLATIMGSNPAGTTYCLEAGTFKVTSTIKTESGDRVIGAGRDATFIDGTGLSPTAPGIFITTDNNYFANLGIFGAPTPAAGGPIYCTPYKSDCGIAFFLMGSPLTVQSVDCHDNGGNCIGGGGSANITVNDLNCWNNGNAYSMTSEFLYAACIKRVAIYEPGGNTTVTNSYIHDNPWVGLWCDYCTHGLFDAENNRFVHNGLAGIEWEMSGGWTSDDHAIIKNNVFQNNNYLGFSYSGGMHVSTANDITIESNTFQGNSIGGINIICTGSRNPPQPDSRGVVVQSNTMNGDSVVGCSLTGVTCTNNDLTSPSTTPVGTTNTPTPVLLAPTSTPMPPTPTRTPTPVPPTLTPTPTRTPTPTPTHIPPTPTNTPTPIPPASVSNPNPSVINIWARGTSAQQTYPIMELVVDNNIVRIWYDVKSNWFGSAKKYTYNSPDHIAPGSIVRVAFVNDANSRRGGDRNLKVDKIEIDGITYQSENISVYSVGGWIRNGGCTNGYLRTEWLYCNGYFQYIVK